MKRKMKRMYMISVFTVVVLLTAGCSKTPENDLHEAERPEAVVSETAELSQDYEEGASADATGFPEQMPAFSAKDLNGNVITEDIFGEKDLTVVNIWGTFCTPCVAEMPELGEWARSMPDNVQIVGLIIDISGDEDTTHHDLAVTITEKAGAEFTHIIANSDFNAVLRWVVGVPTTLFVDKEGRIVGSPVIGVDVEGYKTFVEDYLNAQ